VLNKPKILYHGSEYFIGDSLTPVFEKRTLDHVHRRPAVFATERKDIAALFMFPLDILASIGFEGDVAYICIWGTAEEFISKDKGGYLYTLPSDTFNKFGKEYEWQSFESVKPLEVKRYDSVTEGMLSCGAKVYFINDEEIMDKIRDNVGNRIPILKGLKPSDLTQ